MTGKLAVPLDKLRIGPLSVRVDGSVKAAGLLSDLVHAGARVHRRGCNGCIGMGQAPPAGRNSLRRAPEFPGTVSTREDSVFLCSSETATASALTSVITDPRTLGIPYSKVELPARWLANDAMLVPPLSLEDARKARLEKTPLIATLPNLAQLSNAIWRRYRQATTSHVWTTASTQGGQSGPAAGYQF